jgi:hypothetical protein
MKDLIMMMLFLIFIVLWDSFSRVFVFFNQWLIILWFLMTPFAIVGMILLLEWLQEKLKTN